MKKIILSFLFFSLALVSQAKTIESIEEAMANIDVSSIKETYLLEKDETKDVEIRIITEYLGQSTDVSAKYIAYLTYYHGGEMNNIRTSFDLGYFMSINSVKQLESGVYEIHAQRFDQNLPELIKEITLTIDAKQVFVDDKNLNLEDFTDPYFSSTIEITEK